MATVPNVASFNMAHLLAAYPATYEVLVRHGVDPQLSGRQAAHHHLKLKQVLVRTCRVDDVEATLAELKAAIAGR